MQSRINHRFDPWSPETEAVIANFPADAPDLDNLDRDDPLAILKVINAGGPMPELMEPSQVRKLCLEERMRNEYFRKVP
jgi:hypothetical protein